MAVVGIVVILVVVGRLELEGGHMNSLMVNSR